MSCQSQVAPSFPSKLFDMLEDAKAENFEHVISWQPSGKSFRVHKPKEFCAQILTKYFKQTKFKSFQRQLNIYGFQRIHTGSDRGGYEHKYFVREKRFLLAVISRRENDVAATVSIPESLASKDLSMRRMLSRAPMSSISYTRLASKQSLNASEMIEKVLEDIEPVVSSHMWEDSNGVGGLDLTREIATFREYFRDSEDPFVPIQPDSAAFPRLNCSHELSDLLEPTPLPPNRSCLTVVDGRQGCIPPPAASLCHELKEILDFDRKSQNFHNPKSFLEGTGRDGSQSSSKLEKGSFPFKLHLMLEEADSEGFSDIVSWSRSGSSFVVRQQDEFVSKVMPLYFDQTQYPSFRRQLNLYGFTKVPSDDLKSSCAYCHPSFLRGNQLLCKNIMRKRSSNSKSTKKQRAATAA